MQRSIRTVAIAGAGPAGAALGAYLARSGEWRHLAPGRSAIRHAVLVILHDLHLRAEKPTQGRYNASQRIAYSAVLVMAGILILSGFALYKPTQLHPLPLLFGGYQGARLVHFTMTLAIVGFFAIRLTVRTQSPGSRGFEIAVLRSWQ